VDVREYRINVNGLWSLDTVWRIIEGYETIRQLRKGQVTSTIRETSRARFGSYPQPSDWLPRHCMHLG